MDWPNCWKETEEGWEVGGGCGAVDRPVQLLSCVFFSFRWWIECLDWEVVMVVASWVSWGGFALAFGICLVVVVMVGGGDGGEVFLTIW